MPSLPHMSVLETFREVTNEEFPQRAAPARASHLFSPAKASFTGAQLQALWELQQPRLDTRGGRRRLVAGWGWACKGAFGLKGPWRCRREETASFCCLYLHVEGKEQPLLFPHFSHSGPLLKCSSCTRKKSLLNPNFWI